MITPNQPSSEAGVASSIPLRSRGYDLDMQEFGYLADSSHLVGETELLRDRLEEDGYLFLPGFFKREAVMAARRVVTDRLMEEGILDASHPSLEGVVAKVKVVNAKSAFRPPTGTDDMEVVKTYNADDLTTQNRPLLDLLYKGQLIEFFGGFFGGTVRHYNYTWFRAVSPGLGTPPHCDWVYMSRGTPRLLTTWLPVGDAPLDVGGLMILENSHRKSDRLRNYLSRDVDEYCVNHASAGKIESGEMLHEWDGTLSKNPVTLQKKLGGRWLSAEFKAGDILIFTMRTVHASLDNQSNQIRLSADTRYQPADEPADERYIVDRPRPFATNFKKGRIC